MSAVLKIEEIVLPEDIPLRNGLEVVFLKDYMVHFHNVKGLSGVIVKESTSFGKCIVYIQSLGMYCEPELDSIQVVSDSISEENAEFISRIAELEYTLPSNRIIEDD
tara:strand:- start:39 stop:359 length:321 start_codon:yes stop_codon:yes gene_type:complete